MLFNDQCVIITKNLRKHNEDTSDGYNVINLKQIIINEAN